MRGEGSSRYRVRGGAANEDLNDDDDGWRSLPPSRQSAYR